MTSTTAITGLDRVRSEIARGCREAGRDPGEVTLIAVSKTFGPGAIEPVIAAGQRVFGENRVQEAAEKWPALRERWADAQLHLVGRLQSNKAADAVALFDCIHSLDRPSLVAALALAWPDGHCDVFEGKVYGALVDRPKGTRGFGYDPIFMPTGHDITFGEMDPGKKHEMSHRAVAFRMLVEGCFS